MPKPKRRCGTTHNACPCFLKRMAELEELCRAALADSKHDKEHSCFRAGPDACGRCIAMDKLRKKLEKEK